MAPSRIPLVFAASLLLLAGGPAPSARAEQAGAGHAERVSRRVARLSSLMPHTEDFAPFSDALRLVAEGRQTFRFDTFGDEAFWGDALHLHEALAQRSPREALALGLKIDVDALPRKLAHALRLGRVDLDDPQTTVALLRLGAVVGVTGFFDASGQLASVGIQCALCHSVVDDSLAPGVGRRLDGWANRDLDVGRVIAAAPALSPFERLLGVPAEAVRDVLERWGPGKFDATLVLDGRTQNDDGDPAAVLIPPAFGLAGVNLHTWTGWGSVSHWNALVANLEMGGQGTFVDRRLDDASRFPIAAREGFAEVRRSPDRITAKLPALHVYQLVLRAPSPPRGSFDAAAAERGKALFEGKALCSTCHVPPLYTEPGHNLHTPKEIGVDAFQSERSPAQGYRTSPLAGLWTHQKGGFYHDGRFETLGAVVNHYQGVLGFQLEEGEKADLVEFLKSL